MTTWKIEDDSGTIYEGDRDFIVPLFTNMVDGKAEMPPTTGDINLVKETKFESSQVYAVIKNRPPVHG